ncbi:MAG: hydrogenase maturation protease [Candidatus Acidiferrum sp.]
MQPQKTILIGVGNPFRSDDGAGRIVLAHLRGRIPTAVEVLEETGDGAELLDNWKDADSVIVVDAVQSGAPPGTIHVWDARTEKLPGWFSHSSTHAFGVAEAIELARTMGDLPQRLIVYGIEGLDFSAGTELSPEVAQAVPTVAKLMLLEILCLSGASDPRDVSKSRSCCGTV